MPSASSLPAAGQAAKAAVSSDLVSVFFKNHSDSSYVSLIRAEMLCSGPPWNRAVPQAVTRDKDPGQETFHGNAALEEIMAATLHPFCMWGN